MATASEATTRVLVADDNAVDRKLLSTIVRKAGYEVIDAVSGTDALEKYYSERPDLVLLDALMPDKDGFEVAQEIKAHDADGFVPIVFLTSLTDANELARCLDAGGDDFLSKPYNRVILEAKLNALQRVREVHHTVQAQRDEIARHHMQLVADQEAAKAVFDNVAHSGRLDADYIQHLISPLALFNGDVLLAATNPANDLYLLMGDFTGHGLAAAIGAMPLADVFYGMTAKGFTLGEIARECNRKLGTVLPSGYFCCAVMVIVDFNRGTTEYWNGGIPSAYLRRAGSDEVVQLASTHLPLGIVSSEQFNRDTQVVEVAPDDRLMFATDGLIEARDDAGALFGSERLEKILSTSTPGRLFNTVRQRVYAHMGDQGREDDLTMVEIKVVEPQKARNKAQAMSRGDASGPKDWKLTYELGPESLYYAARSKALEHLSGFVRFELASTVEGNDIKLKIGVTDSGSGFDYEPYLAGAVDRSGASQYHGRGLSLLRDLCESIEYAAPGNRVNVTMAWEVGDE
jgi:DNA-binding response OmpR family regulator